MKSDEKDPNASEAKELESALASLIGLSGKLNSIHDLNRLMDTLVEHVLALTHAETGCAGFPAGQGISCDHFLQGLQVVPFAYDCQPGIGWAGWLLTNGTFYFTNEASTDNVILPEIRDRFKIAAGMSIPIVDSERRVIAFFEVYHTYGSEFSELDVKNCLAAAQIASLAIQNGLTRNKLLELAALSRSLTLANNLEQIVEALGHQMEVSFHASAAIFLPTGQSLSLRYQRPDFASTPTEIEAASWCWEHGEEAGATTAVATGARGLYLPLIVRGQVIGVLGLLSKPGEFISGQDRAVLSGFIGQAALSIERGLLDQRVRRLRFLDESGRLQNALLAAVSHEVRAPLAAITAAVSGLLTAKAPVERSDERRLLKTAEDEARRLHRLMNNLLNVTRLQSGASRVKVEPCDILDVLGAALEEIGASAAIGPLSSQLTLEVAPDLPLVPMDFELIKQVLVNLISNAIKFSPEGAPIRLGAQIVNGQLEVTVADRGRGIPDEELNGVFEKFHRLAKSPSVDGLGLGLSICKEFVEAHQGQIWLEQNTGGGTVASFVVPLQQ